MGYIKDSGARQQFYDKEGNPLGVRDITEGKGRMDLVPLTEAGMILQDSFIYTMGLFLDTGRVEYLKLATEDIVKQLFENKYTALIEVSKHYEDGAKKYAENNWKLGISLHCFIDSAVRHYCKHMRGDDDEPHFRACLWNCLGALWTVDNKPELWDLFKERENNNDTN